MRLGAALFMAAGLSLAMAAPATAVAQDSNGQAQAVDKQKQLDPNEVVCEKQEETGSRLSVHRVCKTRAQWAEERRNDRQEIDKIQTQRGCNNGQGC